MHINLDMIREKVCCLIHSPKKCVFHLPIHKNKFIVCFEEKKIYSMQIHAALLWLMPFQQFANVLFTSSFISQMSNCQQISRHCVVNKCVIHNVCICSENAKHSNLKMDSFYRTPFNFSFSFSFCNIWLAIHIYYKNMCNVNTCAYLHKMQFKWSNRNLFSILVFFF